MKIRIYCKAKHLTAQLVEIRIYILKLELKWMLARLQMNEKAGS